MSWTRAVAATAVALAVSITALVVVPNLLLTRLTGLDRSPRVAIATAWFTMALVGLAWALRRLQAHHVV